MTRSLAVNGDRRAGKASEAPVQYVFIAGVSYCGSTLLSFLMNAHPSCVSAGESTGPITSQVLKEYHCSCGSRLLDCVFWRRLAARMGELGHPFDLASVPWKTAFRVSRNRYINFALVRPLGRSWAEDVRNAVVRVVPRVRGRLAQSRALNAAFARAALDLTGKSVFVDACKDAQRLCYLKDEPGIDLRVIHLVRDVRGAAASFMKNVKVDAVEGARVWALRNLDADRARRFIRQNRWLRVRYSDLCSDVQGTMDRIWEFVEVPPAPVPEDFRAAEHHIIGNRMRLSGAGEVQEDVSWREKLRDGDLEAIARAGGKANHYFGYDWPAGD